MSWRRRWGEESEEEALLSLALEVEVNMQIRARLLQRTLGGGGNRGLL